MFARITRRIDARGTIQRLNFEARIVGEAVQSGMLIDITRFLRRIALDGGLRLGNLWVIPASAAVTSWKEGPSTACTSSTLCRL